MLEQYDKKRVLCRISSESLVIKYGASENKFMLSVTPHRTEIQETAKRRIEGEEYEEDGSVLIQTADL
jgi:Protein of unknown function (DUF1488)